MTATIPPWIIPHLAQFDVQAEIDTIEAEIDHTVVRVGERLIDYPITGVRPAGLVSLTIFSEGETISSDAIAASLPAIQRFCTSPEAALQLNDR